MSILDFLFGQPAATTDSGQVFQAPPPPWETPHVEAISMNRIDFGSDHTAPVIDPFYGVDHSPPPIDPFYGTDHTDMGDGGGW